MSSDWLFVLVFCPSVIALSTMFCTNVSQKERERIFQKAYFLGFRRGEQELARKIYENICPESGEDEDDDE